ncbi:UDP-forming cellulose synthase catalytic subunit [Candidatus Methylospira mobilis]|uniref:UDP-forming cellulose synthase catalytic subunit n=1 Tax=Candidatus Methylospira mobilis TaxID=1808979 RepID=UPI001D1720F8|nr:UDP-forming cellulose synthase catalytic subunit [Candidatus Methylospira mobilis]WNV03181.1 UDP-forming cellulose synthase catalytic subunit [Candidatus Methylospira mobilis]
MSNLAAPEEWLLRLFVLPGPEEAGSNVMAKIRQWLQTLISRLPLPTDRQIADTLEKLDNTAFSSPPLLKAALLTSAVVFTTVVITTPLDRTQQLLFFLATWGFALLIKDAPGVLPTVILVMLAELATLRYAIWRVSQTMELNTWGDRVFGVLLLFAEAYTWLITLLSFLQSVRPLRRPPLPMPVNIDSWPSVDIFIPTYNEPLDVVRTTVYAAQGIDWPAGKIRVYVLDDGKRDEFRHFSEQTGVGYITRSNNAHAKAGNLNHALTLTQGEYIAIFDCDHIPTRSFLQVSMGWLIGHPRRALLQTPHHFFSADPFERNLNTFRQVPNEGYLFNRLIQDGNDLWNAAFFCGSCAILKRAPLEEIGGIAVETVTEDAHTALKLHRRGYESIYLNIPLAAGLATESLSAHVGQRIRWARGMVQIFRSDNPLLGKGLSLSQRLCYGNATLHFFYGIPRLIFLFAPQAYLFFELHFIHTEAAILLFYVLPYIFHSNLTNARIQGRFRHSFWAEVYETVLAWYITLPTTLALFNPKLGKFNVTPKGGLIEQSFVDWRIAAPYLALLGINLSGFLVGIGRLLWWNRFEMDVVLMNLGWTLYNLTVLGTAFSVATEARQVRKSHRVPAEMPAVLYLPDGRTWHCKTHDFSTTGLALSHPSGAEVSKGELVSVGLYRGDQEFAFPARVEFVNEEHINVHLMHQSIEQQARFIHCTFSRADVWADWHTTLLQDSPLNSLLEVLKQAIRGYRRLYGKLIDYTIKKH